MASRRDAMMGTTLAAGMAGATLLASGEPVQALAGPELTGVSLWADGGQLASFSAGPYVTWWPLSAGAHRFWAQGVNAAGQVVLSASWEIRPIGDERKPVRRHSHYQRTVPGNPQGGTDTEGQVAAMSAELGDLAADLAAALAPLAAPPSRKPPRDLPAETSNRS